MPSQSTSLSIARAAATLLIVCAIATACASFDPETGERTPYGKLLWRTRDINREEEDGNL